MDLNMILRLVFWNKETKIPFSYSTSSSLTKLKIEFIVPYFNFVEEKLIPLLVGRKIEK